MNVRSLVSSTRQRSATLLSGGGLRGFNDQATANYVAATERIDDMPIDEVVELLRNAMSAEAVRGCDAEVRDLGVRVLYRMANG